MNTIDEMMRDIAEMNDGNHPFDVGQPLWVRRHITENQDFTAYISLGFTKTAFGKWQVDVVAEDDIYGPQYTFPVDWMTSIEPYDNTRRIGFTVIDGGRA